MLARAREPNIFFDTQVRHGACSTHRGYPVVNGASGAGRIEETSARHTVEHRRSLQRRPCETPLLNFQPRGPLPTIHVYVPIR